MSRVVVVVGSVGAGKSSLINALCKADQSTVSHSIWDDGTTTTRSFYDDATKLHFIDTPGLDSSNATAIVTEKVQKDYAASRILIVWVMDSQAKRVNSHKETFNRIKDDLVGNTDFVVVWTNNGHVSAADKETLSVKFPKAAVFDLPSVGSSVEAVRAHLARPELYAPLKVYLAAERAAAQRAAVNLAAPKKVKKVPAPPKAPKVKLFPMSFPAMLGTAAAFRQGRNKRGTLSVLIPDVIALKKDGGTLYQELREFGDAFLKPVVLTTLKSAGVTDALVRRESLHKVIDNAPDCALTLFYIEHMQALHDKELPGEADSTEHSKADVVEALLELARRQGDTFACIFIVFELFRLVDNHQVIALAND